MRKKSVAKKDIDAIQRFDAILRRVSGVPFARTYQRWHSLALRVVQQTLPDRLAEFRELHRAAKPPKELDVSTYTISDYLMGMQVTNGFSKQPLFDIAAVAMTKFQVQVEIVASAEARLDSLLADVEGVLEAGLLDDELDIASDLAKNKHLRAAGVVAGVVLERHLKRVLAAHEITFRKKPQIASLNDALKVAGIYDVPQWRRIQRLGDIRNLCGHDGEREPARDEVDELIAGVAKIVTTVF
jgi:hypothetical protein